jgi:hypothetical protein
MYVSTAVEAGHETRQTRTKWEKERGNERQHDGVREWGGEGSEREGRYK